MKKTFIALMTCVILLFSGTAMGNEFIYLQLEDRIIPMYCNDRVKEYDSLDGIPVIRVQKEWKKLVKSCTENCEMWRGWIVGEALCIEIYFPKQQI